MDGEMAYVMEDVPAGSTLDNLEIQVLDASGMCPCATLLSVV